MTELQHCLIDSVLARHIINDRPSPGTVRVSLGDKNGSGYIKNRQYDSVLWDLPPDDPGTPGFSYCDGERQSNPPPKVSDERFGRGFAKDKFGVGLFGLSFILCAFSYVVS